MASVEDKPTYDNYYRHCKETWILEYCDSKHNDRCPHCDKEIQPYLSLKG